MDVGYAVVSKKAAVLDYFLTCQEVDLDSELQQPMPADMVPDIAKAAGIAGATPLQMAVIRGNKNAIKTLIKAGADPKLPFASSCVPTAEFPPSPFEGMAAEAIARQVGRVELAALIRLVSGGSSAWSSRKIELRKCSAE